MLDFTLGVLCCSVLATTGVLNSNKTKAEDLLYTGPIGWIVYLANKFMS